MSSANHADTQQDRALYAYSRMYAANTDSLTSGPSTPSASSVTHACTPHHSSLTPPRAPLINGAHTTPVAPLNIQQGVVRQTPPWSGSHYRRTHARHAYDAAQTQCMHDKHAHGSYASTSSAERTDSSGTSFYSAKGYIPGVSAAQHATQQPRPATGMTGGNTIPPVAAHHCSYRPPPTTDIMSGGQKQPQFAPQHVVQTTVPEHQHSAPQINPLTAQQHQQQVLPDMHTLQQLNPADLHDALTALAASSSSTMYAGNAPLPTGAETTTSHTSHHPAYAKVPGVAPVSTTARLSATNLVRAANRTRMMPERSAVPASPRTSSQRILKRFSEASRRLQRGTKHAVSQSKARGAAESTAHGTESSPKLLRTSLEASVQSLKLGVDLKERSNEQNHQHACAKLTSQQPTCKSFPPARRAVTFSSKRSSTPNTPSCQAFDRFSGTEVPVHAAHASAAERSSEIVSAHQILQAQQHSINTGVHVACPLCFVQKQMVLCEMIVAAVPGSALQRV